MNNALALGTSESSSGCESGWTLYLDNASSSSSRSHSHRDYRGGDGDEFYDGEYNRKATNEEEDDGEKDLSMVSDASSGPPHFSHHIEPNIAPDHTVSKLAKRSKKRQKVKQTQHLLQDPSFLDDTASSPLFDNDFSMNNVTVTNQQTSTESVLELDYSQGFSATYFEERSSLHHHFGFLKPSLSENQVHNNKWYGMKEMGMI
ncbi:protein SOB FIVE-LIKE 5-like isoform X2 [Lotus japonicus]|uniref:protein SOB FIVE-LIKE 5-like isoform X2 n=1 Tax=Lotus japonicus TaxID=34305 RepID=UPI0025832285|nr:protein SOB FIVE-LIKE 5-like isoform X2 [Lotus japonicus]